MSERIFKVTAAPAAEAPKEIQAALLAAKETGILAVPQEAMCLMVPSGVQVEVPDAER